MSTIGIVVISDVATLAMSLFTVVFMAGRFFEGVRRDVHSLQQDVTLIKGMFTLKLRTDVMDRD